MNVQSALILLE